MESLDYTYNFSSGIKVGVNGDIFEQSFGNREETKDILDLIDIANQKQRKVIGINGTAHSNKVASINAQNIKTNPKLVEKGIDGVVIKNLDKVIDKISLILGVADCSPIAISNKNGDIIGLVHAGHTGVAKDIIGNLLEKLEKIDNIENFLFYVGPTIGDNFEIEEDFYFDRFQKLCDKYKLKSGKYFSPTLRGKGNLYLKNLIFDILKSFGISTNNISFSDISTNSLSNNWPSYRLHTIYKNLQEKLKNKEKLTKQEKELFESENKETFKKDKRIGVFVEN